MIRAVIPTLHRPSTASEFLRLFRAKFNPLPPPLSSLSLSLSLILGNCLSSEAAVTDLVSSGEAVWASTEGGHVITFDPVSGDVLLVHRRHCHASSLVCVGMDQVVVFGRERVEGVEGEEDEEKNLFTVWDSYVKHRVT